MRRVQLTLPALRGARACSALIAFSALAFNATHAQVQPQVAARAKPTLVVDRLVFKDLNGNGRLDPYEDWRLPVAARVRDLVSRMTVEEKAGMLLINTLNPESGGRMSDKAVGLVKDEKMTRFIFRSNVTATPGPTSGRGGGFGGAAVTAYEAAQFTNSIQELAESTRLGIPVVFKSNARNHLERDARPGISVEAGSFSEWPKEAGLAATRDMDLVGEFGRIMAQEWTAIGLRGMYGYMADLATEPRWFRVQETFTEDSDLAANIITTLVKNIQGERLGPGSVALTIKHFPGGGPQKGGADSHYTYGKEQSYPTKNYAYHLKPFKAAIAAGVSAIMPYYSMPAGRDVIPNNVGMAFSKGIITNLLRDTLGFQGYLNSDTGIIGTRAWGLEDKSVDDQIVIAIGAGIDVLSGFESNKQILQLVTSGRIAETRLNQSVGRLLVEQFRLGLFENPYVDPNRAAYLVGNRAFQLRAEEAQRKSVVLLQNQNGVLPIRVPTPSAPVRLYTMGMKPDVVSDARWNRYSVVSGDFDASKGERRPVVPSGTDYAILRVEVSNQGANPEGNFGGASADELDFLAFSDMAKAKSWKVSPSLEDIRGVMSEVGAQKTILSVYFRQPFVLDEASGMRNAGAILAAFGVRDAAIMDVITGKFRPTGKLPFALAGNAAAIKRQASDEPGYDKADTLFPFGFGLSYK